MYNLIRLCLRCCLFLGLIRCFTTGDAGVVLVDDGVLWLNCSGMRKSGFSVTVELTVDVFIARAVLVDVTGPAASITWTVVFRGARGIDRSNWGLARARATNSVQLVSLSSNECRLVGKIILLMLELLLLVR